MSDIAEQSPEGRDADRRVQKTRAALRSAFNELILTKGYDAFSAADVAECANVGRSTFYEHFQGKDDILAQSLVVILSPIADSCATQVVEPRLTWVIDHLWQNRRLASALMAGRSRILMSRQLASLIEERLAVRVGSASHEPAMPGALLALQLAAGQLALIEGWLSGRHGLSAEALARALHAGSYAAANAVTVG